MNCTHTMMILTMLLFAITAVAQETTEPANPAPEAPTVAPVVSPGIISPVEDEVASGNLLISTPPPTPAMQQYDRNDLDSSPAAGRPVTEVHHLQQLSMFAITPPEPRAFATHDLIQIIVRESSTARRSHELETEKEWELDGQVSAWPDFRIADLLQLMVRGGSGEDLPQVGIEFDKEFSGEGEYQRRDDMTDRLTAEVIEVLPNGNLIIEARTRITTDDEHSCMTLTGICRPDDVSPVNTILSNQIHDLNIVRSHEGELKTAAEKGIIAKVLETIFAF